MPTAITHQAKCRRIGPIGRHGLHQRGFQMGFPPVKGVIAANQAFEWMAANFDGLWFSLQNAHGVNEPTGAEPRFSPVIDGSMAGLLEIQWV
jgi:hypothetical protein